MPNSHIEIYIHLVWSTWDRSPLLYGELKETLYANIQADCEKWQTEVLAIGGVQDHIHLLVRLPSTLSVAELVKQLKGSSSHLATHVINKPFKWQGSYGAFSVSKFNLPKIKEYILNQEQRHRDNLLIPELEITG